MHSSPPHTHAHFLCLNSYTATICKNYTWKSLRLFMKKDNFVIHLTVQYLSDTVAMMGNFNER